ncbi:DNA cytosine methyltransferase [Roseomonas sp. GC11]|uniref:DNA cytosine methyltransferase n=1 Tax=Roseomonas sp. GC11 TaxID=2950546 RepID=UPI00210C23B6|nr:DNA cytosine methyltransferase [Roseomonas sp. GC11]MCQ4158773.1 DNA cytosine methyltransferase [Roseomonas sp. GC11]
MRCVCLRISTPEADLRYRDQWAATDRLPAEGGAECAPAAAPGGTLSHTLNSLDLFAGIGGFALGFERAGIRTSAFCEINPYPQRVLAHRFPGVPIYPDVRELSAVRLRQDGVPLPDLICGGFPCQDISLAGRGAGLSGERSGLWWEFHRLINECRPAWVVAENSPALRSRGVDAVLRSLAEIGYDALWNCIPASALGARHRRDRIWLVAHTIRVGRERAEPAGPTPTLRRRPSDPCSAGRDAPVAHAARHGRPQGCSLRDGEVLPASGGGTCYALGGGAGLAHPHGSRLEILQSCLAAELASPERAHGWATEPDVGRVAYGVPSRVDRITALGNAVVPLIPEIIGRAIVKADAACA